MARALLGRLYEPLDGDPAGTSGIRQQKLVDSRELVTLRRQCDVLWMRLLGPKGEVETLAAGARESAACPASSSAAPAERSGNVQDEVRIGRTGDWAREIHQYTNPLLTCGKGQCVPMGIAAQSS